MPSVTDTKTVGRVRNLINPTGGNGNTITMQRYTYPHTIENGSGESLTILRSVPSPKSGIGERLEVENCIKPGAGPPMHVHFGQEESLTVQQGRIGYRRPGGADQFAGPGETVTFPAGEEHRFWNAGEDDLRCVGYIEPADNLEYFLTEIFASTRRNGGTRPEMFEAAFLTQRYRSEFAMTEIPAPVRRFVFPVLVVIGSLLGRYKKYADAPEPIRR
jgi:uncharacterized cupin superfamily protein